MPTTAERRALVFAAAVAVLGVGARVIRAREARPAPGAVSVRALDAQIARVDSARKSGRAGGARQVGTSRAAGRSGNENGRPAQSSSPPPQPILVDVDVADVTAIDELPWIGPALAARIVEYRERCGPFGSLEALMRVNGIGPGTIRRLAPYVTFSGRSRHSDAARTPGCQGT